MVATGTDAIGWRVEVFWEEEDQWFPGVITEYDEGNGYYVCYDDGDEKWTPSNTPDAMRFLSNTIEAASSPAPVTASHDYSDDGFEDKAAEDDPDVRPVARPEEQIMAKADERQMTTIDKQSLTSSIDHAPTIVPPPEEEPKSVVLPAKPAMRFKNRLSTTKPTKVAMSSAVFFKDREELLEIKAKLAATKAALLTELAQLKASIKAAEETAQLTKDQLAEYTSKLTVAQLHPATAMVSTVDERILELTARNRQMNKDNLELEATRTETIKGLESLRTKTDVLTAKWLAVPQRDKVTLVELNLEIALLTQHRTNLEAQVATLAPKSAPVSVDIEALKSKLTVSDARVWDLKRESYEWKQRLEQEQAKLSSLAARKALLATQLERYRSSKALLRSAFDRCDSDGDGTLSITETVRVLQLLAPPDDAQSTEADVHAYFRTTDCNGDGAVDFAEFCKVFDRLTASK
ncbi:hypothetical protein ACHHYP_12125 [Achlya hypogyna]|uniref:EF-hand domain-containing protein n=1 Tax=Achlya hypogyna TaxID=1202772 RepID=A0A1V9ZHE4_ACHHY|nr:hypothetical protein ACHHYP_12125 [Achlya hypogyna]